MPEPQLITALDIVEDRISAVSKSSVRDVTKPPAEYDAIIPAARTRGARKVNLWRMVETERRPPSVTWGIALRVQGSGFRVQGSGFRVQESGLRVQGPGLRIWG
jgi:hypothetical protein